jgi:SulP family sulfate permease
MSITFLVGMFTFFLGLFHLGSLANVVSQSVLTGFLTASALVIALSQFKYLLGIPVPRFTYSHQTIIYLLVHLHQTNWAAVVLGFGTLAILLLIRHWKKKNKKPPTTGGAYQKYFYNFMSVFVNLSNFLIILLGALIAQLLVSNGIEIRIVGNVPKGFLPPSFNLVPAEQLLNLVPSALAIAFVAFAGNWAVTVKYANLNHYKPDATQELVGTGLAMTVGMLFNAFVVSGGLARSAVNAESGAQTQLAGCITAICMIVALCTLTSFFYYIPMAVLAAIIEVSIVSMLDFESMVKAYHKDKRDCLVMVVTFLFTFFLGVTQGLFVGFCISIAFILRTTAFPHIGVLGRLLHRGSGDDLTDLIGQYRDVKRFPEAEQIPGYAIIRLDASLYFANCEHFKSFVLSAAEGKFHSEPDFPIHTIILDASAWIDIDLTGVQTLFELRDELLHFKNDQQKITLLIAAAKGVIRDRLKENKYVDGLDRNSFYMSIDDAISRKRPRLSQASLDDYLKLNAVQNILQNGNDVVQSPMISDNNKDTNSNNESSFELISIEEGSRKRSPKEKGRLSPMRVSSSSTKIPGLTNERPFGNTYTSLSNHNEESIPSHSQPNEDKTDDLSF